ncbi:hypothetical protein PF003_g23427 [Phytophthora fragariae]|nr:hypothetical protein PF003_g23427 [Phytophthora fragariae]
MQSLAPTVLPPKLGSPLFPLESVVGFGSGIVDLQQQHFCGEVVPRNLQIAVVLSHTVPELPTNGGDTPIFREVVDLHLVYPSVGWVALRVISEDALGSSLGLSDRQRECGAAAGILLLAAPV